MAISYHRPTRVVVDLAAIKYNVAQEIKHQQDKHPSNKREVFAVVKANGYGHGAVEVAKAALAGGATGFCVATLDEGMELRESGVTEPILILGIVAVQWLPLLLQYQLAVPVTSMEWIQEAQDFYDTNGLEGTVALHLTLDTGMGRIGFQTTKEALAAVSAIEKSSGLLMEGMFTHFATADMPDQAYFEKQSQRFAEVLAQLPTRPRYVHVSNSATALWREDQGNMVRLGISMYGQNPSGGELAEPYPLQPAMALESELVQVKQVPVGEGIGYGKTYTTTETQWIGTVPIGYADGYIRQMQGFHVLVDGHFCEIVGRVCMDQLMIRLPQAFALGTKVTLIGQNKGQEISMQAVADHLDTIHYEVMCLLSDRIPRVYLHTEVMES